jgi:hypothetical protein
MARSRVQVATAPSANVGMPENITSKVEAP